jgi:hypothetical protein
VRIDPAKVKVIQEWPLPATKGELQSFLGTTSYVHRFCDRFADDAGPLFDIGKPDGQAVGQRRQQNDKLDWTPRLRHHFAQLKVKIGSTPVLAVADFDKPFFVRMDASDFAIGGVLFQKEGRDSERMEQPVAFAPAEQNYSIREKELLAILFALRVWRVYLLDKPFVVETEHRSLETVFTQKTISRRIDRWCNELSEYPVTFKYIPGENNEVADGISRRPNLKDDEPVTLAPITTILAIRARVSKDRNSIVTEAMARYGKDLVTAAILRRLTTTEESKKELIRHIERYALQEGVIIYSLPSDESPRTVLPAIRDITDVVLHEFHDVETHGHPGIERIMKAVEKCFYWKNMAKSVKRYVSSCEVCLRTKSRNSKSPGLLQSHPIPTARWQRVAMDFLVGLPETARVHDSIMVVVVQAHDELTL